MNKKLGLGVAAAAITTGLVYLYKHSNRKKTPKSPESAGNRHLTEVFAKAKPQTNPALSPDGEGKN